MINKIQSIKEKLDKLNLRIEKFFSLKDTVKRMKRSAKDRENICKA
jgi:prefoldin subunit 5